MERPPAENVSGRARRHSRPAAAASILLTVSERIWSPWRIDFFTQPKEEGCVFCKLPAKGPAHDDESLIVHRGKECFVILNKYPYTAGHLMIVPFEHTDDMERLVGVAREMFELTQRSIDALRKVMGPDGFNVGMNLGKAAGAGIPGHGHLHVVPRWNGDNNFMTVLADRRIISEGIAETLSRLKPHFVP